MKKNKTESKDMILSQKEIDELIYKLKYELSQEEIDEFISKLRYEETKTEVNNKSSVLTDEEIENLLRALSTGKISSDYEFEKIKREDSLLNKLRLIEKKVIELNRDSKEIDKQLSKIEESTDRILNNLGLDFELEEKEARQLVKEMNRGGISYE